MPKTDQLALSQHVHLLPVLSAERIAGELKRLMAGAAALPILRQASIMRVDQILFCASFNADVLVHPALEKLWGDLSFVQRLACCLPIGQRVKAGSLLKLILIISRPCCPNGFQEASSASPLGSKDLQGHRQRCEMQLRVPIQRFQWKVHMTAERER